MVLAPPSHSHLLLHLAYSSWNPTPSFKTTRLGPGYSNMKHSPIASKILVVNMCIYLTAMNLMTGPENHLSELPFAHRRL